MSNRLSSPSCSAAGLRAANRAITPLVDNPLQQILQPRDCDRSTDSTVGRESHGILRRTAFLRQNEVRLQKTYDSRPMATALQASGTEKVVPNDSQEAAFQPSRHRGKI